MIILCPRNRGRFNLMGSYYLAISGSVLLLRSQCGMIACKRYAFQ